MADTVLLVSALVAIACANAAVWWRWGRTKAAEVRTLRESRDRWRRWATQYSQQLAQLTDENKRLTAGAVVARLHEQMGDRTVEAGPAEQEHHQ